MVRLAKSPPSRHTSGIAYLIGAVSARRCAHKDFDWGDRDNEAELHRYYGMPPYWGGFWSRARVQPGVHERHVSFQVFRIKFPERLLA